MEVLFEIQYKHFILLIGNFLIGYMIYYIMFKNKDNNNNKDLLLPRIVPYKIPWIGSAISYGMNPTKFLSECRERYGGIFTLKLAGKNFIFVLDPLVLPQILKEKNFFFSSVADKIVQQGFAIHKSTTDIMSHQTKHPQKYLGGEHLSKLIENTSLKLNDTILKKVKSNDNYKEW